MKNYLFSIGFILLTIGALAQTQNNKLGITSGGGLQNYKGDLGNGFKFKTEAYYGVASLNIGYYLNRSFDISLFGTMGDYGYCQTTKEANKAIDAEERCPGCGERLGRGNLNSRMASGGVMVKYKLANGCLFSEKSKLKPYVYFGTAVNGITDIMKMNCVRPGTYYSFNAGLGAKYYISDKINIGYNLGFGRFTNDHVDFTMKGGNDLYMQNTVFLGIDLF